MQDKIFLPQILARFKNQKFAIGPRSFNLFLNTLVLKGKERMTIRQAAQTVKTIVKPAVQVRFASTQTTTSQTQSANSSESTQRRRLKLAANETLTSRESIEMVQRREARKSAQRETVSTPNNLMIYNIVLIVSTTGDERVDEKSTILQS